MTTTLSLPAAKLLAKNKTITARKTMPKDLLRYMGVVLNGTRPDSAFPLIPIDTPMDVSQRDLKVQNIYKYIRKLKGVDWNLFGIVTAAKYPDGRLTVINGQHRINLVKILLPDTTHVPAHIINVSCQEEAANYFHGNNGTVSKSLSNEEMLWAEVLSGDRQALYMKSILEKCNLSCGKVNKKPTVINSVKRAAFWKCLELGEKETLRAVELITKGYKGISDIPLHGLTYLLSLKEYKDLGNPTTKIGKQFEEWLTVIMPSRLWTLSDMRYVKFQANPQYQKGVAYGLVKHFAKFQRDHSRLAPPSTETIRKIWEIGCKSDHEDSDDIAP